MPNSDTYHSSLGGGWNDICWLWFIINRGRRSSTTYTYSTDCITLLIETVYLQSLLILLFVLLLLLSLPSMLWCCTIQPFDAIQLQTICGECAKIGHTARQFVTETAVGSGLD